MATLQFKRGPNKNVSAAKPAMLAGEPLFTTDTGKLFIFDGTNLIEINPDHTSVPSGSLTAAGILQLNSAVDSTDEATAATPKAVKTAYDLATGKADKSTATAEAAGLMSAADKVKINALGTAANKNTGTAAGNVPEIGADGKLNSALLPALAISEPFPAATEAAMLALDAQKGDIAIRADVSKSFILAQSPASTLVNWLELKTPTCNVLSVAGRTGAVMLTKTDVGLGNAENLTRAQLLASPALTGVPTAPTPATTDNGTQLATTGFVKAQGYLTNSGTIDGGTF